MCLNFPFHHKTTFDSRTFLIALYKSRGWKQYPTFKKWKEAKSLGADVITATACALPEDACSPSRSHLFSSSDNKKKAAKCWVFNQEHQIKSSSTETASDGFYGSIDYIPDCREQKKLETMFEWSPLKRRREGCVINTISLEYKLYKWCYVLVYILNSWPISTVIIRKPWSNILSAGLRQRSVSVSHAWLKTKKILSEKEQVGATWLRKIKTELRVTAVNGNALVDELQLLEFSTKIRKIKSVIINCWFILSAWMCRLKKLHNSIKCMFITDAQKKAFNGPFVAAV